MKNKSKKASKNFQSKQIPHQQLKAVKGGDSNTTDTIIVQDIING